MCVIERNDNCSTNRNCEIQLESNLRSSPGSVMTGNRELGYNWDKAFAGTIGVDCNEKEKGRGKAKERWRGTARAWATGRQRGGENSIDQSAISNAELLIGYRFIADGKSGTACYRVRIRRLNHVKRRRSLMTMVPDQLTANESSCTMRWTSKHFCTAVTVSRRDGPRAFNVQIDCHAATR